MTRSNSSAADAARAIPWIVLLGWLLVHLAVVLYWGSQEWGFLGDLWLIVAYAGSSVGLIAWLTAWAVLSDWTTAVRGPYFQLGVIGLACATGPLIRWWEGPDVAVSLAAVVVGIAVPLALLRRRGWRIRADAGVDATTAPDARGAWQFSVFDLFIVTTGVALVLTLVLVGGPPEKAEIVFIAAQILCGLVILVVSLAGRSVRACLWSTACTAIVSVLGIALVEPQSLLEPSVVLFVLLFAAPAVAALLTAAGVVRWWGYRLSR